MSAIMGVKTCLDKVRRTEGGWRIFWAAFFVRLIVVFGAWASVPPTADGEFYHVVAGRVAEGLGYTWLWPDGAVTYAAHYPVGYPLMMGGLYALFGPIPGVVMIQNALLGSFAVLALYRVLQRVVGEGPHHGFSRHAVTFAAWLMALSPTLVFYTPALMTESEVGSLLMICLWGLMSHRSQPRPLLLVLICVGLGYAVLLRPQAVLLVPLFGWYAVSGDTLRLVKRSASALVVSLGAMCVVLPWTLRNCDKMEACVFVSANGGWNLLIGTFPEGRGAWVPLDAKRVPEECRQVFQEAEKDHCFGAAGRRKIAESPLKWAELIPSKLTATFDYSDPAASHLGEAGALSDSTLGLLRWSEYLWNRAFLALALLGSVSVSSFAKRRQWAMVVIVVGVLCSLLGAAWVTWTIACGLLLCSRRMWTEPALGLAAGGAVTTIAVHAIFFGAARYGVPALWTAATLPALGVAYIGALLTRRPLTREDSQEAFRLGS